MILIWILALGAKLYWKHSIKISKRKPLTSILGLQSRDKFISGTVDSNWEIRESQGKQPDWTFVKSSFLLKLRTKLLKISCLKIFPKTRRRLLELFFFMNRNYIGFFSRAWKNFFLKRGLKNKFKWIRNSLITNFNHANRYNVPTMRFFWDFFDDLGNIIFTIGNFIYYLICS